MIVDSHMHVGDFPLFNVSMDRDGLVAEMREHEVSTGLVFHLSHVFQQIHDVPGRPQPETRKRREPLRANEGPGK